MLEDKRLDKDVPIPLYFQLEKLILEEIDNGNYPVGSMIPTEMELSQMFGISRTTVRQAISDLVREEHLYRIKSKGTFVAHPKLVQGFIQSIQSFDDDVRSTGRTPSTEVLDLKLVELEPEVAQLMELPAGTKAIYLYRKRFADDEPIVRVETYLPYEACSFILGHDFNRESLYQVLSKRDDTRVTHVTRICEARAADPEDAAVLGLKRGRPVHYFQTIGYNQSGKLIELSFAHYRGDQSRFRVELFRECVHARNLLPLLCSNIVTILRYFIRRSGHVPCANRQRPHRTGRAGAQPDP